MILSLVEGSPALWVGAARGRGRGRDGCRTHDLAWFPSGRDVDRVIRDPDPLVIVAHHHRGQGRRPSCGVAGSAARKPPRAQAWIGLALDGEAGARLRPGLATAANPGARSCARPLTAGGR